MNNFFLHSAELLNGELAFVIIDMAGNPLAVVSDELTAYKKIVELSAGVHVIAPPIVTMSDLSEDDQKETAATLEKMKKEIENTLQG